MIGVPLSVILDGRKGGFIEGDTKGGVWWLEGKAAAVWGDMIKFVKVGDKFRKT